jgi:hypothetical protein
MSASAPGTSGEFTRLLSLEAADDDSGRPVYAGEPVQAVPGQDAVHGGCRQAQDRADLCRSELAAWRSRHTWALIVAWARWGCAGGWNDRQGPPQPRCASGAPFVSHGLRDFHLSGNVGHRPVASTR